MTHAIKIDDMTIYCQNFVVNRELKENEYNIEDLKTSVTLKEIYFKDLKDVLAFCKKILEKAKIINAEVLYNYELS